MTAESYNDKLIRAASCSRRGNIGLRTEGQINYVKAIRNHAITLCAGPAGTGKTFLAVACALEQLHAGKVDKIVLSRPVVEAGEKLGYLKGDVGEKVAPYMVPIFDSLNAILEPKAVKEMIDHHILEVAPLAYIRGRTFNNCFMVLDEAQNTSIESMKMYLTRLGKDSRSVVIGDVMQIDIPKTTPNGFVDAFQRFQHIKGIGKSSMTKEDIQRHPLVQEIVDAYDSEHMYGQG